VPQVQMPRFPVGVTPIEDQLAFECILGLVFLDPPVVHVTLQLAIGLKAVGLHGCAQFDASGDETVWCCPTGIGVCRNRYRPMPSPSASDAMTISVFSYISRPCTSSSSPPQ